MIHVEPRARMSPQCPRVVLGDQVKIQPVVRNVTANTIKHTDQGDVTFGTVLIDQNEKEVSVEISLADTGSGITPHKLTPIFRNFGQ